MGWPQAGQANRPPAICGVTASGARQFGQATTAVMANSSTIRATNRAKIITTAGDLQCSPSVDLPTAFERTARDGISRDNWRAARRRSRQIAGGRCPKPPLAAGLGCGCRPAKSPCRRSLRPRKSNIPRTRSGSFRSAGEWSVRQSACLPKRSRNCRARFSISIHWIAYRWKSVSRGSIKMLEDRLQPGQRPAKILAAIAAAIVPQRQMQPVAEFLAIGLAAGHLQRIANQVHQLHLREEIGGQVAPRFQEGVACLDIDRPPAALDHAGLPFGESPDRRQIADRPIVDRPAEHRRVPHVRLVAGYAIGSIAAEDFVQEVRSAAAAGEGEDGEQAAPRFTTACDTSQSSAAFPKAASRPPESRG